MKNFTSNIWVRYTNLNECNFIFISTIRIEVFVISEYNITPNLNYDLKETVKNYLPGQYFIFTVIKRTVNFVFDNVRVN